MLGTQVKPTAIGTTDTMKGVCMKTKEEILDQLYMSAKDLKTLIPEMGLSRCQTCIKEVRVEMENKGYYVPQNKTLLALTKMVRKKFGF